MTDTSRAEVERVAGEVSENAGNIGRQAAALLLAVTAERDALRGHAEAMHKKINSDLWNACIAADAFRAAFPKEPK
jgi:hypothetical protein